MRSLLLPLMLSVGCWFGGPGEQALASDMESVPADFAHFTGRYRIGDDRVITFWEEDGQLFMKSLTPGVYWLYPEAENRFRAENSDFVITFLNNKLAEVVQTSLGIEQMAVRMNDDEKVPHEYLMEGNLDRAIRDYLEIYEKDPHAKEQRALMLEETSRRLAADGQLGQSLLFLNLITMVYPQEAIGYKSLGDLYLMLAIENYSRSAELEGTLDETSPILEYLLQQNKP